MATIFAACGGNNAPAEEDQAGEPTNEEGQAPTIEESPIADDKVVANVNGEELLGGDYNSVYEYIQLDMMQYGQDINDEQVKNLMKQQALEIVIGNRLMMQDAASKGYEVEEAKVKEELDNIKGQFESEEALNEALEQSNLTMEELERQVREDMVLDSYIENEVELEAITDEEVKEVYDQYFNQGEDSPSLEEMEENIKQMIEQQNMQVKLNELVDALKENSEIEILI